MLRSGTDWPARETMAEGLPPGLHQGDALNLADLLKGVPPFTSVITSPPYWDMTDYGVEGQLGHGQSLEDYLDDLRRVFAACADVSSPHASLWLVVGAIRRDGVMIPLPAYISDAAGQAGWTLREQITWDKTKSLPWTKHGELRDVTEHILLLTKDLHYKFNVHELLSPEPASEWWVRYPERYSPNGRMPTNIWRIPIPTQGSWRSGPRHACPFPPALTYRLLTLATDRGDAVLDPFAGVGSVPAMARAMGRYGIGLDLAGVVGDEYAKAICEATDYVDQERRSACKGRRTQFRETILRLRLLKYARLLSTSLASAARPVAWVRVRRSRRHPAAPNSLISADFSVVTESAQDDILPLCVSLATQRPLSKFGIDATFTVEDPTDAVTTGFWFQDGKYWRPPVRRQPATQGPHVVARFIPRFATQP